MTISVLNIGKSDVLIKSDIYENYWIPIGFDRDEPNLKFSSASDYEKTIWNDREEIIVTELYPKLGIEEPKKNGRGKYLINFRELTEAIWQAYNSDNEDYWHNTIRPSGRLIGAIETISDNFKLEKLEKVYIFVTDQKTDKNLKGHDGDSCFSFKIFQKWFAKETEYKHLKFEPITLGFDPRPQDKTLEFYYDSLNKLIVDKEIKEDNILIISIKGGTPQMQTALQMQAIASGISKQLFIEPQVDVSRILTGKNSECRIISYWRYVRSQRYQIVKLLLNTRWDFQGARVILEQWQILLKFWQQNTQDQQLSDNSELISRIIKTLTIANNCLNLDFKAAKQVWQGNEQFKKKLCPNLIKQVERENRLLHLYTQCRIYDELGQTANFLSRMSSFCEAVLEQIARKLGCDQEFAQSPNKNRFEKRSTINNKVNRKSSSEQKAWQEIHQNFQNLDYWCTKRNHLIHSSEGVSKQTMRDLYNALSDTHKKKTCAPDLILAKMTQIIENDLIKSNEYSRFIGENSQYYIYSAAKDWVLHMLFTKGLQ